MDTQQRMAAYAPALHARSAEPARLLPTWPAWPPLVKQRFPDYTPAQVTDYLEQNATEREMAGRDSVWGYGFATLPVAELTPTANIAVRAGINPDEAILSWDSVPGASYYRIGYVNLEVDYQLAKASCTGGWINALINVDEDARNIPVTDGRAEYTVRRIDTGALHAFTVLTSNNFVDTGGSVSGEFFWPTNPRWTFLPGRAGSPVASRCPPSN